MILYENLGLVDLQKNLLYIFTPQMLSQSFLMQIYAYNLTFQLPVASMSPFLGSQKDRLRATLGFDEAYSVFPSYLLAACSVLALFLYTIIFYNT